MGSPFRIETCKLHATNELVPLHFTQYILINFVFFTDRTAQYAPHVAEFLAATHGISSPGDSR